jgi:hypothetical protein
MSKRQLLAAGVLGSTLMMAAASVLAQGHGGGHASGGGHVGGGHAGGGGHPAAAHVGGMYARGGVSHAYAGTAYGGARSYSTSGGGYRGATYVGNAANGGNHGGYGGNHGGYGGNHGGYGGNHGGYGGYHGGYGGYHGYSTGAYWGGGYWHGGYWPRAYYGYGYAWFLPLLPIAYATYWYSGIPYYYANDVYYTWNPGYDGYTATDPPPVADPSGEGAMAPGAPQTGAPGAQDSAGQPGQIFMYPKNGQSQEQQSVDKQECQQWAAQQAGQGAANGSDYQRAMMACVEGRGYSAQ